MAVTITHPFVSPVADAGNPDEVGPNEWNAAHTVTGLGTAAEANTTDFATAAQGTKADTAVQPGSLATVATTGAYADLSGKPTLGTAAATAATDYATAAQGAKADSALQSVVAGSGISVNVTDPQNPIITATGSGTGDMLAATYDPQAIAGDAFARANHTGTQSADTLTDGTTNKAYTATEKTKLAGIATGATANSSDATLLARANHTGTQAASTISDFSAAADARVAAAVGVSVQAYDADLTTWAGLTPSANAQSLVTAADYAGMRALLDLEAGTDFLSPAAIAAAYQPLDADLTAWAGVNPSSYSTTAQVAAAYQPLDSDLTSWGGVTRASGFDTFAATPSSANLATLLTDETGTGSVVFATSPTLVTPALGTPSSVVLTNATGLPTAGIVDDAVTNAKLANMAANTIKGRVTASTGDPEDLTAANVKTILALAQADISGLTTASSPQFAAIELGNATDTTLSRGAAGFIAVEGKRVPSPASQASGDLLYRGATEWERLAKGTAAQVLTMNAGATAPEWATASSGGMTLLGTITATSGTTASLGSLSLSSYVFLYLYIEGLSHNDGSPQSIQLALSSTNGGAYGTAVTISVATSATNTLSGYIQISGINSTIAANKRAFSALNSTATAASISTNTAGVVDAIRLTWTGSFAFDATGPGIIRVYGVK